MKKFIMLAAALAVILLPGCKELNSLKVTYIVYSTAVNAATMPDAEVLYRHLDGTDHTATVKTSTGFQYSMVVPRGTHINLRATVILAAPDGNSNLLTQVLINDSTVIVDRECDCSNGIQNTDDTSYKLICDFQGEAIGYIQ